MAPRGDLRPTLRARSRALLGVPLALLLGLSAVLVAPPATAAITVLCEGYKGCREDGMGNGGYARHRDTMYWRMYSGHNCTNYAAYRMVRSGLPNTRPWEGGGNAEYWGYAMAKITDSVPRVGSVAWWPANVGPAGSSGHVAYVEEVVSADTIIVSQDSWGGDFSWARITRSGSSWPTGFIHFNDVPMVNRTAPAVQGTAKVGATVTADGGTWRPADPELRFQWRRNGRRIDGATAQTYTVTQADKDTRLSVSVTASKLGYPSESERSASVLVLPGELAATEAPSVAGTPVVEGTLTAGTPGWNVEPDSQQLQWLADGVPVQGATGPTFVPQPRHVGQRIRVLVTATRDGYEPATTRSPATAPVASGTLAQDRAPSVDGSPRLGHALVLDPGAVSREAEPAVTWLRDGQPVPGATGTSYPLTAADLGARLAARVEWTRDGYTPLHTHTTPTRRVKSPAALDVRVRSPRQGRLRLVATVSAPEVAPLTGTVVFRSGRRHVVVLELADGRAVARMRDLPSGSRTVRVRYRGSAVTTRDREEMRVSVR